MPTTPPPSIPAELQRFQGRWQQVRCEVDGVAIATDEFGAAPITTFTGDRYVVTLPDGTVVLEGTFVLDPTQEPEAVDWIDSCGADADRTLPAIYAFVGDELVFCAADADMSRPTEFRTRVGDTLRAHRRLGPADRA